MATQPARTAPVAIRAAAREYDCDLVVAIISSPEHGARLEDAMRAEDVRLLAARRDFPIPVETMYEDPSEIGADRLCNALAAMDWVGKPVISASAGTCLTVEAMDAEGVLIGGAICSGVMTAAAGIGLRVPHLKEKALEATQPPQTPALGRSTVENLRIGLWLEAAAAMQRLITLAREALGVDAPVVLTGGDASTLAQLMSIPVSVVRELTLEGVRIAFERWQASTG